MRTHIAIALVLVLGSVPVAGAKHLSSGIQDSALVSPSETPGDPSVSQDLYERATSTDCYQASDEASAEALTEAANADPLCGRLAYGQAGFEQTGAPDQDIRMAGWTFDVVMTSYVGNYGISPCEPWCLAGQQVYTAAHDAGASLGLTPTGEEAWAGDGGRQEYAVNLQYPNAAVLASQTAGAWEGGNGWTFPLGDQSMVAFLEDANGDPIDQERLDAVVTQERQAGNLGSDAAAQVCAFTPDQQITIGAPQATFCEVLFLWASEEGGLDTDVDDDYNDPCTSPAYVCGAATPAWYAAYVCLGCADVERTSAGAVTLAPNGIDGAHDSTKDYDIWHYVVAPSPSACTGAVEPGMAFDTGAPKPYLAHDLDIYQPATEPVGFRSYTTLNAYRNAVVEAQWEAVQDEAGAVLDQLPDLPGLPELPETPTDLIDKQDVTEPNTPYDTAKTHIAVERTAEDDPCSIFRPNEETAATVDPWVDILDNEVTFDVTGEPDNANGFVAPYNEGGFGPYLTGSAEQDASNRPGPAQFFSEGKVGVFTDIDDDGAYDQASANNLKKGIQTVGAYPMFWDMRADPDGTPSEVGCTSGFGSKTLPVQMVEAGYGVHTGLIQVTYLREPTYLYQFTQNMAIPYTQGNTAFVWMSQALQVLAGEDLSQPDDPVVAEAIQKTLDAFEEATGITDYTVAYPTMDAGVRGISFGPQCGQPTGGYASQWSFFHSCQLGCSGDTVVTSYLFEVTPGDGVLGGGDLPVFDPTGTGQGYSFGQGLHQWIDLDPLDNDPERTTGDGSPPTG